MDSPRLIPQHGSETKSLDLKTLVHILPGFSGLDSEDATRWAERTTAILDASKIPGRTN